MLKFLSLTALASAIVLSAATIAPVYAHGHSGMGMGGGARFHSMSQRRVSVPHHPRYIGHLARLHGHDRDHHHHYHHFHWRHGSYWAVGVPVVAGVAAYEASGPAPVCTCLTKEYLDDGAVRFTDTCTRETAIAVPPVPAPRG